MSGKKLQIILLCVITLGFFQLANAQKVEIKLHQPPPNQLGVGDMWNLELTNTTDKDIKIYLTGTATEEKDGLIIEGKSKVFTLKPGRSTYKYNDFSNAEVKYNNGKYKEIILRTGNAPEGSYTICVTAFDESGTEVGRENCIMQTVKQLGSITLITPENGAEVNPEQPIMFSWTPLPGAKDYTLKIVEIKGDQSPDAAMKTNKAVWEKSGITTTSTQVPYIAIDDDEIKIMDKKKKFAWMVKSGDVESEVWSFSARMLQDYDITLDSIKCTDTTGLYRLYMNVVNNHPTEDLLINSTELYTPSPTFDCVFSTAIAPAGQSIILTSPPLSTVISPGGGTQTFTMSVLIGSTSDNYFNFKIFHRYQPSNNGGFDCDSILIPRCSCCGGFVKNVEKIDVRKDSSSIIWSSYIYAGPNPIKKVTAEMVYFYQNWKDTNCAKCVTDSKVMGNFSGGTLGGFGAGSLASPPWATGYSREIDFSSVSGVDMNSGKPLTLNLELPPQSNLDCCADTIRLCIRFSFTDTACVTCDTVICRKIVRTGSNITNNAGGKSTILNKDNPITRNEGSNENVESNENEIISELTKKYDPVNCGKISGTKYNDLNGNGIWDTGEPGLPGWTINILTPSGTTVSVTTGTNGFYQINMPAIGTYIITEVQQLLWTQTAPIGGSYTVVKTFIGQMAPNNNFGNRQATIPGCCDNFDINITSSVSQAFPTNPFIYTVNSNITAGPNRISKVRAFLSNYEIKTSNPDCDRCMNKPLFNGSLLPVFFSTASNISGLSGPVVTAPSIPVFLTQSVNLRELVWGGDGLSSVNLTSGISLGLWVIVPAPSLISCCADTIKFCMKYSFTDTTCVTCDTMVCYQIVRSPSSTLTPFTPEKEFKKLEQDFRKHMKEIEKKDMMRKKEIGSSYNENFEEEIYITETNDSPKNMKTIGAGFSGGVINLTMVNTSVIKVRIYNSQGKEILKLYDDYLKAGHYSFDLNKHDLPDGVYYYSIESDNMSKIEKLLIAKPTNGCNCVNK